MENIDPRRPASKALEARAFGFLRIRFLPVEAQQFAV